MNTLHNYYLQYFYNNINTTKDKFYKNYLITNLNFIFQKRFEFSQYSKKLKKKKNKKNISIKIKETEDNTFNPFLNYNQNSTFISVFNTNNNYIME